MTNAEFSRRAARVASTAAAWAAGSLDLPDRREARMREEPFRRFIREMRERLDYMEADYNAEVATS